MEKDDYKLNLETTHKNVKIIDISEIEGSTFKTKKKTFVSDINPHLLRRNIQKENYIWFGVYDGLLRNKNIISYIKKCRDTSLPLECAAIHLEKYSINFCKIKTNEVKAFLFENEGSVVFLKLYLITKSQLIDIIINYYKIPLNQNESESNEIFDILNKPETSLDLTNEFIKKSVTNHIEFNEYTTLRALGELDGIMIYSMTTDKSFDAMKVGAPDTELLRNIYLGLKKSFSPYSEFLLMYYLYRLEGVRNFYSINQLKECFFTNKGENSSIDLKNYNLNDAQTDNLSINPNNLNNNPQPLDDDTVKDSTCNALPYVSTPEKDQLNQYSYIFDLHHLPIFDENTGEFFWSNNEANWKKARDNILKSEELTNYNKSLSINHGSIMSMSGSFMLNAGTCTPLHTNYLNTNNNLNTLSNVDNKFADEELNNWAKFKNEGASNTFVDELNNLLKDFEK